MKTLAFLALAGLFFGLNCQKPGGGTGRNRSRKNQWCQLRRAHAAD
jgi:hypothetical protein